MRLSDIATTFRALSRSEKALLLGQSISVVGDFMAFPAMLNVAAGVGPSFLSCFLVAYFLPRCLQPFLGFMADRLNAKWVAIASDLCRATVFLLLYTLPASGAGVAWNALWLATAFVAASLSAVFEPARLKVMSRITSDFAGYNSLSNLVYSVGGIVSLGAAIVVEVHFETRVVFLVNAITFAASVVLLAPVRYCPGHGPSAGEPWRLSDMWDGFAVLLRHREVLLCTTFVVLVDFLTGAIFDAFPAKAAGVGMGLLGAYVFYTAVCVGNTAGTLFVGRGLVDDRKWLLSCAGALSSFYVFQASSSAVASLAACLCFFLVQMLAIVSSEIQIQRRIPDGYQGRLFAINESLPFLSLSAGGLAHAFLGEAFVAMVGAASFSGFLILALSEGGLAARVRMRRFRRP
jgi:hypothetical protein